MSAAEEERWLAIYCPICTRAWIRGTQPMASVCPFDGEALLDIELVRAQDPEETGGRTA